MRNARSGQFPEDHAAAAGRRQEPAGNRREGKDCASGQTVTVLIPTFNRAGWLIETLESILAQTRRPDEIIVVIDGSTDDTLSRLQSYRDQIRIVTQENSGKAAALNKALTLAQGNLIWIFDDDDIAVPDALETLVELLADHPQADFAYGRHDRFEILPDGRKKWRDTGYWRDCPEEDFLFESLLDMFAHQPGMLVRKSLYDRVGRFDERLIRSQDYDMLLRLARRGRPVPTDKILFHQRQHESQRGTTRLAIRFQDRQRVWQMYDQMVANKVYRTMPLEEYLPHGASLSQPGMLRRAHIRRGIVMVRKRLWHHAQAEFLKAARLTGKPLTRGEITDLRKVFYQKYEIDGKQLDAAIRIWLLDVKDVSPVGGQICSVFARALFWRVRQAVQRGQFVQAVRLARLIVGLSTSARSSSAERFSLPLHR